MHELLLCLCLQKPPNIQTNSTFFPLVSIGVSVVVCTCLMWSKAWQILFYITTHAQTMHVHRHTHRQSLQLSKPNYSPHPVSLCQPVMSPIKRNWGCWLGPWGRPLQEERRGWTPRVWLDLVLGLQGLTSLLCCWTRTTQPPTFCFFTVSKRHLTNAFKSWKENMEELWGPGPRGTPSGINLAATLFPSFQMAFTGPVLKPIHPV